MRPWSDCSSETAPLYAECHVAECAGVEGAFPNGSVFSLTVEAGFFQKNIPAPGQFFMLRAKKSGVLLSRPISVFNVERPTSDGIDKARAIEKAAADLQKPAGAKIMFLILLKGQGTEELCSLKRGDELLMLGPLGNSFPKPKASECGSHNEKTPRVAICGGGIGVAPVAGFASTLPEFSYDFYASFKSGSYGLQYIKPAKLIQTTDDGSVGIHGMISAALDAAKLKEKNYEVVYACGPTPMLKYIQQITREAGVKCYLSLESRMACGMGVCLGCTIKTSGGYKRCCKDGPVFDAEEVIFEPPKFSAGGRREPLSEEKKSAPIDLSVKIKSRFSDSVIFMQNPVIASSGTFGFGTEYRDIFDVSALGGISSKGLTLEGSQGNSGIRVYETPSGLMNSIGLQNPGIPHFIEHELPLMRAAASGNPHTGGADKLASGNPHKAAIIANLSGSTIESYVQGARLLEAADIDAIELNISCPNVSAGGAALGMKCEDAGNITRLIRGETKKPLIVKLTPQAPDITGVALACLESGADAISLCNSFQGIAIDIERGVPVFDKIKAGFGGPAVRPIALRLVWEVVQAINALGEDERIPVIGIGGIATWQDAIEFIMAGAAAVQVGTATFANPFAMKEIIQGIEKFMNRKGYHSIEEIRGIAQSVKSV